MMIKANELRVGNLYLHGETIDDFKEKQIAQDLADWHPIPLTLDWLFKMGFEPYHMNPRLEYFYHNIQGYYPFQIYQSREGHFFFNENLWLKSVHQIQNLYFALTGQELQIKL